MFTEFSTAPYCGVTKVLRPNSTFYFDIMPYKCKIRNYALVLEFALEIHKFNFLSTGCSCGIEMKFNNSNSLVVLSLKTYHIVIWTSVL